MSHCPNCGTQRQREALECAACGIVYAKFARRRERPSPRSEGIFSPEDGHAPGLLRLIGNRRRLFIEQQFVSWWEVLTEWEKPNQYAVSGEDGRLLGSIQERRKGIGGLLQRLFLGSHRPLDVAVITGNQVVLDLTRPFFFFFSELDVVTPEGRFLGRIRRRFSLLNRRYDLEDGDGHIFAEIRSPFFRIWTFTIFGIDGERLGVISKKWSGLGKEMFSDIDNFVVDYGDTGWSSSQRAVIFAAALSIDFDFFENNHQD